MPEISRFYGVRITMYADDHVPPHFHAEYNHQDAMIAIATGTAFKGNIAGRAARMVNEWAALHRSELLANWEKSQTGQPLDKITPLQ